MSDRQIIKAIRDIAEIMGTPVVLYERDCRVMLEACGGKPDADSVRDFSLSDGESEIRGNSLFIRGKDGRMIQIPSEAEQTGRLCASALENLSPVNGARKGKPAFFNDIFMGHISRERMIEKARTLKLNPDNSRSVFIVDVRPEDRGAAEKVLSSMYPEREGHTVITTEDGNLVLVAEIPAGELRETAETIADMINSEAMIRSRVAFGNPAEKLSEVGRAYIEALEALRAGRIFLENESVTGYADLLTGRLILNLSADACRDYLRDVFGEREPFTPDDETRVTIDAFFENSLNISETGRQLFLHRNTLVYRLEKLQRETGLDIRKFDDAMTLKLALLAEKRLSFAEGGEGKV